MNISFMSFPLLFVFALALKVDSERSSSRNDHFMPRQSSIGVDSEHSRTSTRLKAASGAAGLVDPFLGTVGSGHTFPGAAVPWGMVQATPWCHPSEQMNWDTVAGFPNGDGPLHFYGMAHSALSGAGTGELGELRLRPFSHGKGNLNSYLKRQSSTASPGYFSAKVGDEDLPDVGIESSATPHGAIHRFTFKQGSTPSIELDLSEPPDAYYGYKLFDHNISATSDRQLEGCSSSLVLGIGDAVSLLCFAIKFDHAFINPGTIASPRLNLNFPSAKPGSELVASVGISRTDRQHAVEALTNELHGKSFDDIRNEAEAKWNNVLGVIEADIEPVARKKMFYTALYHSMLFPSLLSDADGSFRVKGLQPGEAYVPRHSRGHSVKLNETDKKMPLRHNKNQYSTFSLWDTYRGLHSLINILHPVRAREFGTSLLAFADVYNDLPPWQLLGTPTDMMDGDGGSIVLATMARQGLMDKHEVLSRLNRTRRGQQSGESKQLNTLGYIPASELHAASKGLEQAMADSCVSRLANDTGDHLTAQFFQNRVQSAFKEWDPKTRLFEPINSIHGNIIEHSSPDLEGYTEGTPLQYSFGAPFDVEKLVTLHGGAENFACDLDYFFYEAPEPSTGDQNVEGNIHGFSIGNEPCMHIPYLYSLAGYASRTQAAIDMIAKQRFFNDELPGLPGNDDLGQMSSWLIFSMLGFYPVDPCSNEYVLGRPFINNAKLKVMGGVLSITVYNQSDDNMYVKRAQWLGRDLDMNRPTIMHDDLIKGGQLNIWMTRESPGPVPRCKNPSFRHKRTVTKF